MTADSEPTIKPLTAQLWPAFVELLDQGGPAGRCWCMAPRIGTEYRRRSPQRNQADFGELVEQGPPPGLLAQRNEVAVGWCAVSPREALPAFDRGLRTKRLDDQPVWVIACLYVRKGHRRQGLSSALIAGAVDLARAAGAPAVEAFPLDSSVSPSATSTGYASTFAAAGFVEVARRSPARPAMRLSF
ncbi:MAG TPA: GNAT family N-acetyltransferase [Actinomycetales bacterium]|nr:GNAT family N-acetyltransferase [Actinomycetales bacterium]